MVRTKSSDEGLFCDPEFPAVDATMLCTPMKCKPRRSIPHIIWRRPHEIVPEGMIPKLRVDGVSRSDVKQGACCDCWCLSALCALAQHKHLVRKIIPHQPLTGEGYDGKLHLKFWQYGKWVDVVIDDLLPIEASNGELYYAQSTDPREFWVSMVEKAYAKLCGSYEGISMGEDLEALTDFTGGLAERLRPIKPKTFYRILKAHHEGAIINCSTRVAPADKSQKEREEFETGLVFGHAYSITKVMKVKHHKGEENLVRIRNPWAESEWKGSWSDSDTKWELLDKKTREKMEFERKEDGEFWMCFDDVIKHFPDITVCHMGADLNGDGRANGEWSKCVHGEWVPGISAGGRRGDGDCQLYATNPQFLLTLRHAERTDYLTCNPKHVGKCSLVINMIQKHRRSQGLEQAKISFALYEVKDRPTGKLAAKYLRRTKKVKYLKYPEEPMREVTKHFHRAPGHYVIIPSMYESGSQGAFMIRVYAQINFSLEKLE